MKEYIERAAIHELVKRIPKYEMFNYDRTEALLGINPDDVDFGVDKIPTADVVEVRHGRWIHPVPGDGENHCSVCHAEQPWFYGYGYYEPDYCPNCGARMDKEDE